MQDDYDAMKNRYDKIQYSCVHDGYDMKDYKGRGRNYKDDTGSESVVLNNGIDVCQGLLCLRLGFQKS